jgi:hypothetical protein
MIIADGYRPEAPGDIWVSLSVPVHTFAVMQKLHIKFELCTASAKLYGILQSDSKLILTACVGNLIHGQDLVPNFLLEKPVSLF